MMPRPPKYFSDKKEYRAWAAIKQRCYNPKCKSYYNYGARGIRMFEGWLNDPVAFVAYVGPRPSPAHSIERIDNDGNYEPGNVKWATRSEQMRNKRPRGEMSWLVRDPSTGQWKGAA